MVKKIKIKYSLNQKKRFLFNLVNLDLKTILVTKFNHTNYEYILALNCF